LIGSAAKARPAPSISDVAAVVAIKWRRLRFVVFVIVSSLPKFRKSNSSFNHLVKNFIFGQGGDANCVLPNGLPGLSD